MCQGDGKNRAHITTEDNNFCDILAHGFDFYPSPQVSSKVELSVECLILKIG